MGVGPFPRRPLATTTTQPAQEHIRSSSLAVSSASQSEHYITSAERTENLNQRPHRPPSTHPPYSTQVDMSVSIQDRNSIRMQELTSTRIVGQGHLRKRPGQRRLLHLPRVRLRRAPKEQVNSPEHLRARRDFGMSMSICLSWSLAHASVLQVGCSVVELVWSGRAVVDSSCHVTSCLDGLSNASPVTRLITTTTH